MYNIGDEVYVEARDTNEVFTGTVITKKERGFFREPLYVVKVQGDYLRAYGESRLFPKEAKK